MKYEKLIEMYGNKLEEIALLKAGSITTEIPFILTKDVEADSQRTMTFKCPECGHEFEVVMPTDRYSSRHTTLSCSHCGKTMSVSPYGYGSRSYAYGESVTFNLSITAAIEDGTDLVVAQYDVAKEYFFETKDSSFTAELQSLCLFQDTRYDSFSRRYGGEIKRSKYGVNNLYSGRYSTDETFDKWSKKHHFSHGYDITRHYDSISAAVKPKSADDLDMSLMPKIDYDDVIARIKKKTIMTLSTTCDHINGTSERMCVCGRCGSTFNEQMDSHFQHEVQCPNCGLVAHESATGMSDIGNDIVYVDNYVGSSYKEAIILRELSYPIFADTDPDGNLYCFFDDNSDPIETVTVFDMKSRKHKEYVCKDGVNYEPQDTRSRGSYGRRRAWWTFSEGLDFINIAPAGTKAKWSGVETLNHPNIEKAIKYLEFYARFPVAEKLLKGGFEDMINLIVNNPRNDSLSEWARASFKEANSIEEVFGLPKAYVMKLRKQLCNMANINMIKELYAADNTITPEDTQYILERSVGTTDLCNICEILNINIHTALGYIESVRVHQCCPPNVATGLWKDYLEVNVKIGADLDDKSLRYPNSLKREHDKAISKQTFIEDEEIKESFLEKTKAAQDFYGAKSKKFEIKAPVSMEALFEEGRELSHSVGSYTDAIASGKTCILFVRDNDKPDAPYLTLEVIDGKVTQVRGYSNRLVNETAEADVVEFLVAWAHKNKVIIDDVFKTATSVRKKLLASEKIYRILINEEEKEKEKAKAEDKEFEPDIDFADSEGDDAGAIDLAM